MFCSNCGSNVTGKFCSNCGAKIIDENNPPESILDNAIIANTIMVNGVEVDMDYIMNTYGKDKIAAIKYLRAETGASITESKNFIDEAYNELYKSEPKKGFWGSVKAQVKADANKQIEKANAIKGRKKEMDEQGIAYCPKCLSTSLSGQKKGFGIGKAIIGASLTCGIGLVAGNIGAKKVRVTCLKCGYQFWAGK